MLGEVRSRHMAKRFDCVVGRAELKAGEVPSDFLGIPREFLPLAPELQRFREVPLAARHDEHEAAPGDEYLFVREVALHREPTCRRNVLGPTHLDDATQTLDEVAQSLARRERGVESAQLRHDLLLASPILNRSASTVPTPAAGARVKPSSAPCAFARVLPCEGSAPQASRESSPPPLRGRPGGTGRSTPRRIPPRGLR